MSCTTVELSQEKFSVRPMAKRDHLAVFNIEAQSFAIEAQCWNQQEFIKYLKGSCNTAFIAEDVLGKVAGFLIYESFGNIAGLVNLAVRLDCRHQGVARLLIKKFRKTADQGKEIMALVPSSMRHILPFFERNQLLVQSVYFKGDPPTTWQRGAAKA